MALSARGGIQNGTLFTEVRVNAFHTHNEDILRDKNCTDGDTVDLLRSYIFNIYELRAGWVAVNCLVTLYMFVILAIISARFFVPAIEKFTHDFHVSSSVAGAGIMATAASIPTLANNLVGIFIARNDIGLGAVVGGSYFNLFLIPALCGLTVPRGLELNAFSILRDLIVFIISSVLLLWCIQDKIVTTLEAAIMIVVYFVYLLIVVFTPTIEHAIYRLAEKMPTFCDSDCGIFAIRVPAICEDTELVAKETQPCASETEIPEPHSKKEDEYRSILAPPSSPGWFVAYFLFFPVLLIFFIIIPDFQRPGWGRLYPLTILMSLFVIGASSYVIVWMISIIGQTANAPVTVMGMTLLAIGSSLPDAFNSLFAARDGFGQMATSNGLGALNAEMLLCLAGPWLAVICIGPIDEVEIAEDFNVAISAIILGAILMLFILLFSRWRLSKGLGIFFIACYLVFLLVTSVTQTIESDESDCLGDSS